MVAHWLAELDGRRVAVEVPASAANLGAGYDCVGLALALTNKVEVEVRGWSRGEIELTVDGEGQDELTEDRDNRFVRGVEAALRAARGELPDGVGWRIEMHNQIPLARGLGSSAAATVGGLLAGNALLGDPLSSADVLRLATELEGHPDNAAAALLGGFVVSASTPDGVEAIRFDAPRDLRAVLFIPDLRLPTGEMRDVLPATVPFEDAAANLAAVAIGVAGLAKGRFDLLGRLTVDRLHEPGGDLPGPPPARRCGARGGRARGLPFRRRFRGPGLRGLIDRHLEDRRGVRRRGRRHGSDGAGARRRATQRRGQGQAEELSRGAGGRAWGSSSPCASARARPRACRYSLAHF